MGPIPDHLLPPFDSGRIPESGKGRIDGVWYGAALMWRFVDSIGLG